MKINNYNLLISKLIIFQKKIAKMNVVHWMRALIL